MKGILFGAFFFVCVAFVSASSLDQSKTFVCESSTELRADFSEDMKNLRIRFGTQDIKLKLTDSDQGWKYIGKDAMFWIKDTDAQLESKILTGKCKPQLK